MYKVVFLAYTLHLFAGYNSLTVSAYDVIFHMPMKLNTNRKSNDDDHHQHRISMLGKRGKINM